MSFIAYDPASDTLQSLVSAIFTTAPGVTVQSGSIGVRTGTGPADPSTISYYNGSIGSLNIGAGLLLTSGDPTPAAVNNDGSYGWDAGTGSVDAPDAQLQATVDAAFDAAGDVEDVTYLEFQINVTDPEAVGLRFEVVFGSDEYPEWSDSDYVDVAGVYVNGTNYALFNNNPLTPLSVIQANVDSGNFRDNTEKAIPIEYDGVSVKLQITAPIHQGLNTIKIAVADTGDSDYDSGIFVSSMQAVNYSGFGLSQQVAVNGSATVQDQPSNQTYVGGSEGNTVFFGLDNGQDVYDGNGGLDLAIFAAGLGQLSGYSWNGSVLTLNMGANSTSLVDVERVLLGDGIYAALDTSISGTTFGVYAMLWAGFNATPNVNLLSQWVADADAAGGDLGTVGDHMLAAYAPGLSPQAVLGYLYHNIMRTNASQGTLDSLAGLIGGGTTLGDLFYTGSMLSLNTSEIASVIGSIQLLNHNYFE